jgi:hypothetical protein
LGEFFIITGWKEEILCTFSGDAGVDEIEFGPFEE